MKKLVFFLFFVCISAPSFANQCAGRPFVTHDGNQLLYYDAGINAVKHYIECNDSKNNNFMVGCDGKIYKCDDKKWQLVPNNKMKTCPQGWKAASQRIRPENTILNPTDTGDIYFFTKIDGIYVVENSICAYTTQKCDTDYDNCIKNKGVPTTCIQCNYGAGAQSSVTKCIYVKYGDQDISNVEFLYSGFKIENNRKTNVAKYNTTSKCYSIEWHPENTGNITISAPGYTPVTMRVKALLDNDSIQLSTDGSANSRQNTPDTNSAFELQYNEKTNLTCTPNTNYSNTNKCKLNTQVIDTDGNLQKCTSTGWKKINDEPASCTGALEELETTYRDIDLGTSIYNAFHGQESDSQKWIYFYDDANEDNCTEAIKNPCKYSFEDYKKADSECTKKGGKFLSNYDDNGNIILCDTSNAQYITDKEQQPLTTLPSGTQKAECIKSGGTGLDTNGKCICNAKDHLEEYNPENAKEYSICRCMDGYRRNNENNSATGECVYAPEIKTQIERDDMAMQRDAEDAYRNEYDNAQSWANKGTTALSTLMTGEGAMMAARAFAEKIADDDAEEKMSEYITTMKCEYGAGNQVNLGKEETLPGGNELANYYAEYKQLADKLKATKAALNLRPGIESEVLYDRAETGLYQYQTAERQSGGFTSLSRALMNPDGTDATAWNAQRAETNRDLLIGGALATVGLAGSYIANHAINKDHVKKYKELEEKFREIKIQLEHEYPEIFTAPTPQQPIHEESVGTLDPVIPSIETLPANELNAIDLSNLTDKAFNRSEIDLTNEGTEALTTEAKYLDDQLNEHPNMNITITATGHADPDGISAKTATALTNRYKEIFNVDSLPDKYKNKKIGKNDDLALARAEVALKFLTEKLSEDTKKRVSTIAQTRGDRDCPKGTPKEKYATCRYVGFEVQINITGAQ